MVAAMPPPIAAFQLAGYFAWNEEDAGSNPACYTNDDEKRKNVEQQDR
jgi:hypothetical protein